MPIQRHFLDWSSPALPAAAEFLISRFGQGEKLDLAQVLIVVPGSRAGRRLLEILVQRAGEARVRLTPPQIVTEGRVPELLYTPKRPFADELTQKLAWADALRSLPPEQRQPLLPHPPASGDTLRWLELGELLRRVHLELAADGLDFAHVLARGPRVEGFAEEDRWKVLRDVQAAYLHRLDDLQLWDVQTARLVAIRQREIATDKHVVVLGAVDLNATLRQMLDLIADRVTALIHAPQQLADRFDEHGCLVPAAWLTAEIPLADQQIERADGPADQADAAARWLASLNAKYRSDEVVIGVPDESLAPQLLRQLAQCGISGRWAIGQRLAETGPYRLLAVLAEYAERRQFAELARLARHPDVQRWLSEQLQGSAAKGTDWLTALDEYHETYLPLQLDTERLEREAQDERNKLARTILNLATQIDRLLNVPQPDRPAPLGQWTEPLRHALVEIYGGRTIQRDVPADHYLEQALRALVEAASQLRHVPPLLQPQVTFSQAAHLALAPLAAETLPPLPDPNAVELLGWLELALDDAPALIVTSLNEGIVPKSASADAFLPNELRRHLELDDNDRRYARDAYALSVLAASRHELRLVVGHRDADGNPLAPSRLLFAADAQTVARRAVQLFGDPPPAAGRRVLLAGLPVAPKVSALSPPLPQPPSEPIGRISVTQFRSYLACPYRYYLQYVCKLQVLRDVSEELDGAMFGELVHDVLQRFGRDQRVRSSADPDEIFAFVDQRLMAIAEARYGLRHGRPAVRMQVEQIRRRLRAFAEVQAQRTADGWRIIHSEDTDKQLAIAFEVDGAPMTLYGRIDRIDWHPQTDTILVLDYKTADAGDSPERAHRRGGEWVDLQLPLYRHLLRSVPLSGPSARSKVELAFFSLPKDMTQTSIQLAGWNADELAAADATAREVIRKIRQGIFWPPADPPPAFSDDFAPICQDHRLGSWQEALPGETP